MNWLHELLGDKYANEKPAWSERIRDSKGYRSASLALDFIVRSGLCVSWCSVRSNDQPCRHLVQLGQLLRNDVPLNDLACSWYHQSPHYVNGVGVRASCGECHIPYDAGNATTKEYMKLLLFKADRGGRDIWYEVDRNISTQGEWERRRPALSNYLKGL
jgi:NapC/NirT cytochrome c family, N-terminal region